MSYLALAEKAEERLKGGRAEAIPLPPTPETLAASLLAENEPDEVQGILAVWRDIFGIELDRDRVADCLRSLREWQSRWVRSNGR